MQTITDISNLIAGLCSLIVVIRLLTFKRGHRQHSYWIAALSWLLINLNLGGFLFLLFCGIPQPFLALLNMVFTLGFTIKLIKTKGNLVHALPLLKLI